MATRQDLEAAIARIDLPSAPDIRRGRGMEGIIVQETNESITPGTDTELSDDEQDELQRCEVIIERGIKTFFEVGAALLRVRELRLYRVDYPTFEAYCQARWDFSKTYANNLIAATSARNNLTTIVVKQLPVSEAQVRPLTRLHSPDQQRQAWQAAIERAEALGQRLTAALVEAVVREMQQATVQPHAERPAFPPYEAREIRETIVVAAEAEESAAELRAQRDDARQRLAAVQRVLEEYQEHITRAQNYKPTSDRGEAVSPLLRALERVYVLLQQ